MPSETTLTAELPPIPAKRYFTIGEVSELCLVKPHVLRYWEQEFAQLRPVKRRGNRRYYQHHEVLLVRRIRDLLYGQGFTIIGARGKLDQESNGDGVQPALRKRGFAAAVETNAASASATASAPASATGLTLSAEDADDIRKSLLEIAALLTPSAPKR
ncbi:MAG: MerR family transcriptional regulator [Burkholderiales bacterium]|nr:MAG: MerR family transcriptional regulator [Burkholderiales bacterium]TAG78822.1 MAG: MerR family transcriptional regulator [Betaproteobacteria bacterium]